MITSDIFNSLKEGDTLYVVAYYPKNEVKEIKVSFVGNNYIITTQGYCYYKNRLYMNKKDCYVDYIKYLQTINGDIDNKNLKKFNRFIKDNVEYFI